MKFLAINSILPFLFSQTWFVMLTICVFTFIVWVISLPTVKTPVQVNDLKIGKKEFVQMVLKWCSQNVGQMKYRYELKVCYYQNKTFYGRFMSWGKQIVIYLYPNLELIVLVDTIIHEYVHHLQFEKKSAASDYDKKTAEVGYWDNPYEVEARKIAEKNRKDCLQWVMNQL